MSRHFSMQLWSAFLVSAALGLPQALALNIKCIKDDGTISGGSPENSCTNLLPKCSVLHERYKSRAFEALSLKIYGYHKGWDLNTNKTTADTPVGKPMPYRLCNVVGKTIRYQGSKDLSFKYRGMGQTVANDGWTNFTSQQVCGSLPKVEVNKSAREIYLKLQGNSGSTIAAWMLSAMPYEIRSEAYDFFQTVQTPADLGSAITAEELVETKANYAEALQKADQFLNALPPESRAVCSDPAYANLQKRCDGTGEPLSMTDPALRLCTLAQASVMLNEGAVASMIELQIMKNAKASFQNHFSTTFLSADTSPLWSSLVNKAADDTNWWNCLFKLQSTRKCAATVVSGVMGDGAWKIPKGSWSAEPTTDGPGEKGVGRRFFGFRLDATNSAMRANLPSNSAPYRRQAISLNVNFGFASFFNSIFEWLVSWAFNAFETMLTSENLGGSLSQLGQRDLTLSSGIPGIIEKIIRYDICKQIRAGDPSPRCDESAIPNKPNNGVAYSW